MFRDDLRELQIFFFQIFLFRIFFFRMHPNVSECIRMSENKSERARKNEKTARKRRKTLRKRRGRWHGVAV